MKMSRVGARESEDAPQASASALIPAAEVQAQLNQILASPEFRRSARLQRFLRSAVERTLAGEIELLKEYIVGREVFDRGADYDPRVDSIVRVEAQRLRRKLREYYQTHGRTDPILITFHSGSYVPTLARAAHLHPALVGADAERVVALTRPDPRTVAVLPFSNLSPEPEQDYFCDGITEDIINALSSIPDLQVIGRTSLFALKRTQDPHEIGARLGAGTIIEGTVRKAGELLRVSARIVDSETGHARWSQAFDRKTTDVFSIEDEISRSIAENLRVTLGSGRQLEWRHKAPNTDAYILYLKARQAWNVATPEGFFGAIKQFNRAISLYPDYAPPYAGLANTYSWLAIFGVLRPKEGFAKGKHAALEALRLDPALAQAHAALGMATFFFDWDWHAGLTLLEKALALQPSYARNHQVYGAFLLVLGRVEEAVASLKQAVLLDPLSFRMNRMLGFAYYLQRRATEAEMWLRAAIALEPDSVETYSMLARLHLCNHRYEDALNEALKCQMGSPSAVALSILGESMARNGDVAGAKRMLERLSGMSSVGYVDPLDSAFIHLALGDAGAALESLGKSLEERSTRALVLNVDPAFDEIRADSRFQNLVSSLRLP